MFPDAGPHIYGGQTSRDATRSWELWRDDLAALDTLGANSYRMSIEWSRLEPRRGEWDEAAAAQYREQLAALKAHGITPFVTLFHFTLPRWSNGWEDPRTLVEFEAFTRRAAQEFGADVDWWITVNEPSVYALFGWVTGRWPPGVISDMSRASRVLRNLLEAHARAAKVLHEVDPGCQVGLSHHVILMQPASSAPLDNAVAGLADDWANEAVPRAAKTGRVKLYIPGTIDIDETIDGLQGSFDYFGINQYYRVYVRADLGAASLSRLYVPDGAQVHDLGGEIYPEGMYRVLKRYDAWGWPIIITENGLADGADQWRPQYLRGVFHALALAHAEGVDVRGYLHWSLMDNFEWGEGFRARFGLFAVDEGYRRLPRPSVEIFRRAASTVR